MSPHWIVEKFTVHPIDSTLDPLRDFPVHHGVEAIGGNETRWGWMAGAGVEYAFYDNWSTKIEYNYLGFRHSSLQFTDTTGQFFLNTDIQQQIHVVKAGINYRWGWAPVGIRY